MRVLLLPLLVAACATPANNAEAGATRSSTRADIAGGDAAPPSQKLTREGWLSLAVDTEGAVAVTLEAARTEAQRLGGYVHVEQTEFMIIKVPGERLLEAMSALEQRGQVTRREVNVEDVTANYTDLQVRLDNARRFQERLRTLVDSSSDVRQLLELEKELARATEAVERLEGQMRVLDSQTTLATLHLAVEKKIRPGPVGWLFYGGFKAVKWLLIWD